MPPAEEWKAYEKDQARNPEMTTFETKMLNYVVHQYLVSTNKKMAAVAFSQEVRLVLSFLICV